MSSIWVNSDAKRDGHFMATAAINNAQVEALIDTGASSVALSYEDALRVGIDPLQLDFDQQVITAGGITTVARVNLERVSVAGIEIHDVEGMVMPQGTLDGTLLGMSFLNRLNGFRVSQGELRFEH